MLEEHFRFIIATNRFRRKDDMRRFGEYGITKMRQKNSCYSKWIAYLKQHRMYETYVQNIRILIYHGGYKYAGCYAYFLNCETEESILRILSKLDEWNAHNWATILPPKWDLVYKSYQEYVESIGRKERLSRLLYHMDEPKVKHSKYVGSSPLKKRLIDIVLDKIFFIR